MLKRVLETIKEGIWTGRKRLYLHMEITTDDPPPGITSGRMAEIATMVLKGRNSPLREILAPGPGNGWEKQRNNISVTPSITTENALGVTLTVTVTVTKALTKGEALAMSETIQSNINRGLADAVGSSHKLEFGKSHNAPVGD